MDEQPVESWSHFIDLHVENLIPGIVLLFEFICWVSPQALWPRSGTPPYEFTWVAVPAFLAVAYFLGVLSFVAGRLALKLPVLGPFRKRLANFLLSRSGTDGSDFENDYPTTLAKALKTPFPAFVQEIKRRRQRGRLVHAAFLPGALGVFLLPQYLLEKPGPIWILICIVLFLSLLALMWALLWCLYTYAEVCVYQEAHLALHEKLARSAPAAGG